VPKTDSTRYTFLFATAVCVVCALLVAASAVGLRERQENNQLIYRQKNVLLAAGLVKLDEKLSDRELQALFDRNIVVRLIDIKTGEMIPEGKLDARSYDQKKARNDPAQSRAAPPNGALVSRLPTYGTVYLVTKGVKDAAPELVVLPIEGMAMWSTVYGFIALDRDGNTVRGLTFYDQQETPGLGGEIGNPKWQALWHGRKAYDATWEPRLKVIKGQAGPPDKDPHKIDGLSGATITSNGISRMIAFWFSKDGYGPYLQQFRAGAKS
jgi:Na+-transporting NADH:ubiquinone oxidoreductase subunit C